MSRPSKVTYHRKSRLLEIAFEHTTVELPAELLRVYSPSAEVRGHAPEERRLQTGKKYVGITGIEPVGNYAIRLTFDDGHDSGLYSWDYLEDLGTRQDAYWQEYLAELKAANASRLPAIPVGQWAPKA
ncbi:MAG: gamma-butyrobetaine hydroxylase-like domain-containing protein [Pseudomonadota bacterium]